MNILEHSDEILKTKPGEYLRVTGLFPVKGRLITYEYPEEMLKIEPNTRLRVAFVGKDSIDCWTPEANLVRFTRKQMYKLVREEIA
jgi:hypothetical protein